MSGSARAVMLHPEAVTARFLGGSARKLPRPRFTMRQMLLAVAAAAVVMVPLAEESYRRHLVAYHTEQELLCEQKAWELHRKWRDARAAGRSEEAGRYLASLNHWNERAHGHIVMQKVYQKR